MIRIALNSEANMAVIRVEGAQSMAAFKEMIQRGTNLWPDAPPSIKTFADLMTNPELCKGKPLQNYEEQDTSPKVRRIVQVCTSCGSDNLIDIGPVISETYQCSHCLASNLIHES